MLRSLRLLCLFVAVALTAACDRSDEGVAPDARPPVILIGIDGAEWSVIEDMVARGELPGFRRMMQEGIHGHLLNPGPQVSPVVWTTFATGHFAREHGILDFVHPYTEGAKRPVDASLRQRPALWNLVDAEGGDATVIGYFVSHPAEPIDGVIVTDRAWQGLERSVWPSDLEPLAATHREAVRSDRDELFARFLPWDYAPAQADDAESPYQQAARLVRGRIDRHILSEEFLRRMTTELLDRPGDLFVTYFRLVDIASHSVWRYHEGGDWEQAPDPEIERLLGGVVAETYRYVDEVVQRILAEHGGEANILLISDHGFGSATGIYATGTDLLTGNHRPNGVLLAHGPDFASGRVVHTTIMEIFPTLAYLLDLPISDVIPGTIEFDLLDERFTAEHAPRYVERYELDWKPVESRDIDEASQREQMNSLQGLGYIGEGVQLADEGGTASADFWNYEPELVVRTLHADATYYLLQGDVDAADRVAETLRRNAPELMPNFLTRIRHKIEAFRADVPGGADMAPAFEAYVQRHAPGRAG